MHIERLQVETEGFLSGLDIQFAAGLNVIIGARGTGKTSIVELIRFCVGAGAFTEDAATRGRQQAIAVLDGGAVTLTIRDGDAVFKLTRSASGHASTIGIGDNVSCTVLAQNEIEAIGAQASGRLHLIDRFRELRESRRDDIGTLTAHVRSLTVELDALLRDARAVLEEIHSMADTERELADARGHQQALLEASRATKEQQERLLEIQKFGQVLAAREAVLSHEAEQVDTFRAILDRAQSEAPRLLQVWPEQAGPDLLSDYRGHLVQITRLLQEARDRVAAIGAAIETSSSATAHLRGNLDGESRQLRQQLEILQSGIGQASRRVGELEERHGQVEALKSRLAQRKQRYEAVTAERDGLLNKLEQVRNQTSSEREAIASMLNTTLGPTIRVRVRHSANVEAYRAALVAGLRGSGVHYNTLAPHIAREVSPRELALWVESGDSRALSLALGISPDRSRAVITALRDHGVANIVATEIDDGVTLELLDGKEYKPSDRLSIGQRCTVVLPVLLGHHGDPLVLDQPEDHLDNAFIASTLVPALLRRRAGDQFIMTSHNANIPVLGGADHVLVMDSDGEHGFLRHQGALTDAETIVAITSLMEGGAEAFATRARFYDIG